MMERFKLLSAFVMVLIVVNATAQDKDPKAKTILDKLSKATAEYSTVSAEFDYILDNKDADLHDISKGSIEKKGAKYKLKLAGQEITCNGKTLWTFIPDANEVQINEASSMEDEDNILNPVKIFTIYEEGFKYKYDKEEVVNGRAFDIINLYPEDADGKSFHTIVFSIDRAKNTISSIVIKSKDGNIYTIKVKTFTPNKVLSENYFEFDDSKVDEIIDLR